MEIISYYDSGRQDHWLSRIGECTWGPGILLHGLLSENKFYDTLGKRSRLLLLTDGDDLVSFCTFAENDDIHPSDLTPWAGFIFTFPEYRGHRRAGLLFEEIERLAGKDGFRCVYISTIHTGLYEKYGFGFLKQMKDINGDMSNVYVKYFA